MDDVSGPDNQIQWTSACFTKGNAGERAIAGVDRLWKAAIALSHPQHIDDDTH